MARDPKNRPDFFEPSPLDPIQSATGGAPPGNRCPQKKSRILPVHRCPGTFRAQILRTQACRRPGRQQVSPAGSRPDFRARRSGPQPPKPRAGSSAGRPPGPRAQLTRASPEWARCPNRSGSMACLSGFQGRGDLAVVVEGDQGLNHSRIKMGAGALADHRDYHTLVNLAAVGASRGHGIENIGHRQNAR